MRIWAILPLALLILARPMKGQDTLRVSTPPQDTLPAPDPHATRKVISAGLAGAIALAVVADSYYSWWRDAEKPFSFYTEGIFDDSHLGLDKFGHLFGSYAMFKSVHTILSWGGYKQSTALGWALGISLFHGLSIEIGDGFSQYGFDYQDLLFDFAGTAYGYLQAREPFFENFDLKFSYWSGQGLKSPANFTQDYDAMTIWLSFNIHNLLPAKAASYWPGWLNLAVGYGVGEHETQREFLVSLDLNFKGFSTSSEDVATAERLLDLMHFPAPGVKFTPSGKPTYSFFLLK
jgi:hypothetical protein